MLPLTCRTSWGQRIFGLFVLVTCLGAAIGLAATGGAPTITWFFIALFGLASAWVSAANFTEHWRFDEDGIVHRRSVLERLGKSAERHASWDDVLTATDQDGRTWFLEIEGQDRWILDRIDHHEALKIVFEGRGVPLRFKKRPRLFGGARSEPPGPV